MQLNNTTPTENPNIQVETYFTEQLNIKTLHKAMTNIGWSIKADYDNIAFLNPEERAELEEVINKMLNNKNIAQQTEIINYNISQLGQVIMMDNSTSLDNSSKNFQFDSFAPRSGRKTFDLGTSGRMRSSPRESKTVRY